MILDQGYGYTIASHFNGGSYCIRCERTGRNVHIAGDEAADFRAEYDDLAADYVVSGTRASRFTWRELLDTMCGAYFD